MKILSSSTTRHRLILLAFAFVVTFTNSQAVFSQMGEQSISAAETANTMPALASTLSPDAVACQHNSGSLC